MSQSTTEPGNQLNEIINRINALTKQGPAKTTSESSNIPRLTEAYEGIAPLNFVSSSQPELPTLENSIDLSNSNGKLSAEQQAQLLSEIQPLIKAAVKKAVLQEIVTIEKALKTTLEQDVMDTLKKRIESGQY